MSSFHANAPALPTVRISARPSPAPQPERTAPFRILNGAAYFSGECDATRPHCGALCCRSYTFVSLTDEEAQSGRYAYKQAEDDCACDLCRGMREMGLRYILRKRPDGVCVHLDGAGKCSIYEHRPEACRKYSCVGVAFRIVP